MLGLDEKAIAVMCFGFLTNLFTLHACNMLNHLKLINAWCDKSILTMYTIANWMFLRSPSLTCNHHHHLVSEPDPQKIEKEGLAHRPGGSVHCARYEGALPIGF